MTSDPAAFRREDIISVWGERITDPLTGQWQYLDPVHILGRGSGLKLDDPKRLYYSSIYNFYPLPRGIHAGGYRDHAYFRALCLEIARKKIHAAIISGRYEETEIDGVFKEIAAKWLEEQGLA